MGCGTSQPVAAVKEQPLSKDEPCTVAVSETANATMATDSPSTDSNTFTVANYPKPVPPSTAKGPLTTANASSTPTENGDTTDLNGAWKVSVFTDILGAEKGATVFEAADSNNDGHVTSEEWLAYVERTYGPSGIVLFDPKDPYVGLSESSRRMLYNLLGFLHCRDAVEKTALEVLPQGYMNKFPSFSAESSMLCQSHADGTSFDSYSALEQHCTPVKQRFDYLMNRIVRDAGLKPDAVAMHQGKPINEGKFTTLTIPPLKGEPRCVEKAANEYNGDFARIIDVLRCSLIADKEEQLMMLATALEKEALPLDAPTSIAADGSSSGGEGGVNELPRFRLLRLKNRYAEPLFNGYRDGLYSIALDAPSGGFVVCEVQLHLGAILAHKKASHAYYEFFRSYFGGHSDAIEQRMAVLRPIAAVAAASPDALLHAVLASSDTDLLEALGKLCGAHMLGDYVLMTAIRRRCLELAQLSGDELRIASMKELTGAAVWRQGKPREAETYCREALATRRRLLGRTHKDTLAVTNLLAHTLKDQQNFAEAKPLYDEVLEMRKATVGPQHLVTAASMNNLAVLLAEEKKFDEAEKLFREALTLRREKEGKAHRDTLLTCYLLACMLEQQPSRVAEAAELFDEVYEERIRVLGKEHSETMQAFTKLTNLRK